MLFLTNDYYSDIAIIITALDSITLRTSTDRREAYKRHFGRLPPRDSYSVQYGYTKKKYYLKNFLTSIHPNPILNGRRFNSIIIFRSSPIGIKGI